MLDEAIPGELHCQSPEGESEASVSVTHRAQMARAHRGLEGHRLADAGLNGVAPAPGRADE